MRARPDRSAHIVSRRADLVILVHFDHHASQVSRQRNASIWFDGAGPCEHRPWLATSGRRSIEFQTTMKTATLFSLAILAALPVAVLTQPSPPAEGIQLSATLDVRFPVTVAQCEPVLIYYHTIDTYNVRIYSGRSQLVASLLIPVGIGYLEWVCNIPAGYGFRVEGWYERSFVVQPGSSSACLRTLTTTYSYMSYATTAFRSYTGNPPSIVAPTISVFPATYV